MSMWFVGLCVLSLVALGGCGHTGKTTLPESSPNPYAAPVNLPEYRIQSGDLLDIKFFYHAALNESVTVRPDGRISLQIVKEVEAAGLTPAQLTDLLTKKYSTQLQNPDVTVIVRSFSSHRVYVDGEVTRAGEVTLVGPMTALQAISKAGGMKESARVSEVILIRRAADGKILTTKLNLEEAIYGTDRGQDILLMSYDIVFVPRSTIANVNVWVDQYIRKNIPVSLGVYYGVNTN